MVKHLWLKHETLSSIPSTHVKYSWTLERLKRGGGVPDQSAYPDHEGSSLLIRENLAQKLRWKEKEKGIWLQPLASVCVCVHVCMHIHTHAHTHRERGRGESSLTTKIATLEKSQGDLPDIPSSSPLTSRPANHGKAPSWIRPTSDNHYIRCLRNSPAINL